MKQIAPALVAMLLATTLGCLGEERPVRRAETEAAGERPPIPDVEESPGADARPASPPAAAPEAAGDAPSEAEPTEAEPGEPTGAGGDPLLAWEPPYEGTAGIVDEPPAGRRVATLVGVETGRHATYDRNVFTFAGSDLPGYHLEYVDQPVRRCGSGEPVELPGDGWLEVRLEPAAAHDEDGRPTLGRRRLAPAHPVVLEAVLTCDFEAVVTWVLAVESPNRYRVLELTEPARLVVDVRHE